MVCFQHPTRYKRIYLNKYLNRFLYKIHAENFSTHNMDEMFKTAFLIIGCNVWNVSFEKKFGEECYYQKMVQSSQPLG